MFLLPFIFISFFNYLVQFHILKGVLFMFLTLSSYFDFLRYFSVLMNSYHPYNYTVQEHMCKGLLQPHLSSSFQVLFPVCLYPENSALILKLNVQAIFARNRKSMTFNDELLSAHVFSYTKQETNMISVSNQFIQPGDNILIIDDFLANGEAAGALINIVEQAGANVSGVGIVIEKSFQSGASILKDKNYRVESLARISSLADHKVTFAGDTK